MELKTESVENEEKISCRLSLGPRHSDLERVGRHQIQDNGGAFKEKEKVKPRGR